MEATAIKQQSGDTWSQQDGKQVEKGRLFTDEIRAERHAVKLFNMAVKIQDSLKALIQEAETRTENVREAFLKRKSSDKLEEDQSMKGFTFYSFDRSIKIEKIVSITAGYKEEDVALSKQHFEEYLDKFSSNVGDISVLKELVMSAFTTKRGKFDYKKLDQLLEYKDKIQSETFQKACVLLEEAKFNKMPKTYYNIYFLNDEGAYEQVTLKLSGVS